MTNETNDLEEFAAMLGADQIYSDEGLISMLCPEFAGKSMQDLTGSELEELMRVASQFSIPDDDED